MKIQTSELSFKPLTKRKKTNLIVLHHAAATKCSVEDIHKWHLANGWAGFGYHFLVRKDGSIWAGRPEDTVGSHAKGYNSASIGICFEGNYETEIIPDAQKKAGLELVSYLKEKYSVKDVKGHGELMSTACPGRNFPLDEMKNGTSAKKENSILLFQKAAIADGYSFPKYGADGKWGAETESVAKKAVCKRCYWPWKNKELTKLIQSAVGVSADGKFGNDTKNAVIKWQKLVGLQADGIVGINSWKKLLGV